MKLALVEVLVFICPLPLCILKKLSVYPLCVLNDISLDNASASVAVIVPTTEPELINSSITKLLLLTLGAVFGKNTASKKSLMEPVVPALKLAEKFKKVLIEKVKKIERWCNLN